MFKFFLHITTRYFQPFLAGNSALSSENQLNPYFQLIY